MKITTTGDLLTESLRGCEWGISNLFLTLCAGALTKLSKKRKENVCEQAWHLAI